MKLSKIQELLRIVSESGVAEIEIEEDDFKLTIRQNAPQVLMQPSSYPMQMPHATQPMQQAAPAQAPAAGRPGAAQPPAASPPAASGGAPSASAGAATAEASNNATTDGTATDEGDEAAAPETEGYVVKAPIVGTFYEAPSPDSDPYVQVGDRVSEGDVLCIIEAMKLMNEIEAETSGTIEEVLVEDAEPVEFDQPLFVIDED